MSQATELLAQLREIHLPTPTPEPALWPLYVTLLLFFIALCWLLFKFWQHNNTWAREVKNKISILQRKPPDESVPGYATLLKQAVVTVEATSQARNLHGDSWLIHLDQFFKTDYFSNGEGRIFGESLYQPITMDQNTSVQLGNRLKQLINRRSLYPSRVGITANRTQR